MFDTERLNFKRLPIVTVSVCALLLLDRLTKNAASELLSGREPFSVVRNILLFTYVENRGIAFGLFQGRAMGFAIVAAVVSLFCVYICLRLPKGSRYLPVGICMCAIIAGALGNMIDRIMYGYVIDFIYFKPIDFPVFNVADIYITCSAFALVVLLIFFYKDEELKEII